MKGLFVILLFGMFIALGCVQPQVPPTDGPNATNITEEIFCDALTPCEVGECYKFEDKDTPICWEGDPCSRCASGECILLESYPPQVRCVLEEVPGDEFCGWSTNGACSSDSECVTGGCSGQVCQSTSEEPVATTCEWRNCYDASKYGLSCGCVVGECKWN